MLISLDRNAKLQLIKRARYMAQLRRRGMKIIDTNSNGTSMAIENLQLMIRDGKTVKLPQISSYPAKEKANQSHSAKCTDEKKSSFQKKLMDLINKEISLEKHNYFETISSCKALIIKNGTNSFEERESLGQKTKLIANEEEVIMTPPLKAYRSGKAMGKTIKRTIKNERDESCSPWNYQQSDEVSLQVAPKNNDTF